MITEKGTEMLILICRNLCGCSLCVGCVVRMRTFPSKITHVLDLCWIFRSLDRYFLAMATLAHLFTVFGVTYVRYVSLYVKYLLEDSIREQFDAFLEGFYQVHFLSFVIFHRKSMF